MDPSSNSSNSDQTNSGSDQGVVSPSTQVPQNPQPVAAPISQSAGALPSDNVQPSVAPVSQAPMPSAQQPTVGIDPSTEGATVPSQVAVAGENNEKNYLIALLFSYLLGSLGIDRFYLGYIGTGILKLITLGGFGIWHFVDLMLLAFGKLKEKGNPAPLEGYAQYRNTMKPVAIVLLVIEGLVIAGVIVFVLLAIISAAN